MSLQQVIDDWSEESEFIVKELLTDGSDPDAEYTIEHHMATQDFAVLEKAAVDVFKAGFEVSDAEEAELEDGTKVWCFDISIEMSLDLEKIKQDVVTLATIADKKKVIYDGWGTFFEPQDDEGDDEE